MNMVWIIEGPVTSNWNREGDITSTWSREPNIGEGCMAVVVTGFWDDLQVWEDNLFWFDAGQSGGSGWVIEL